MDANLYSAHDMYNALQDEYMGMVKGFNRRYAHNWDWIPNTGTRDVTEWDIMFFTNTNGELLSLDRQAEVSAELDEIKARYRALCLRDDNEAGKAFDAMHNEYLDQVAHV